MIHGYSLKHSGSVVTSVSKFVFLLGLSRVISIIGWIMRFYSNEYYWDPISWFGGIVQQMLYIDFLYNYIRQSCTEINPSNIVNKYSNVKLLDSQDDEMDSVDSVEVL